MSQLESETAPWQELAQLIELEEPAGVSAFLDGLDVTERSLAVSRLSDEERARLLVLLTPELAAQLLGLMPEAQAVDAVEDLSSQDAARILEELPTAEQADMLGDLEKPEAEAILAAMPPEEAAQVRSLYEYEDDEAGGLMITEFLRVDERESVGGLVAQLLENADRYEGYHLQDVYVVDDGGTLKGTLEAQDLLVKPRNARCASIARPVGVRVPGTAKLPELSHLFDEAWRNSIPVVDDEQRLLGIIRRGAVEEAQAVASEEVYRRAQGLIGGEELRTMKLALRTRRRLGWLSINVVLNLLAASVIALNQDVIETVVALAIFLPIISDMSGCSGNQAVAVSIRELALDVVRPSEVLRVCVKESALGMINGVVLGALIGGAAWIYSGNQWLGLVVGSALAINTLVAVMIGGSVPLMLKRFGADPALASGPILTTITDACGFFLTLTLAKFALPHLGS